LFKGGKNLKIVMVGKKAPCCVWFLWVAHISKKKKEQKVAMAIGMWSSTTPSLLIPSFAELPPRTC
jgi:hypothetical protein